MNDTTPEIRKKQLELHLQLSMEERWQRGFEMIENGRASIVASIKAKHPDYDDKEVLIAMVNVLYKRDLSKEFLDGFAEAVRKS